MEYRELKKEKRIDWNDFIVWKPLLFLLIVFLFRPYSARQYPLLWSIWSMARYASVIFICTAYVMRGKVEKEILLFVAGQFLILLFTILNGGTVVSYCADMAYMTSMAMLSEMVLEKDPDALLDMLYVFLLSCLTLNFLMILTHPGGMYELYWGFGNDKTKKIQAWLWGDKNSMTTIQLACIVFGFLRAERKRPLSWTVIPACLMLIYMIFKVDSATAKLSFLVFLFLVVMEYVKLPMQWFGAKWYLVLNLLLDYLLVGKGIQKYFGTFLTEVLERKESLTGRVGIWSWANYWIEKSPFIGYGNENDALTKMKFHLMAAPHAHNYYLDTLYRGGFLVFCMLIVGFFLCAVKCDKFKQDRSSRLLSYGFCAYLLVCQTDMPDMLTFAILLVMMMNTEKMLSRTS